MAQLPARAMHFTRMSKDSKATEQAARSGVGPAKLAGGGESQGGAYPHKRSKEDGDGFGAHGGQSVNAYHGTGQLGDEETGQGNANAPAKGG